MYPRYHPKGLGDREPSRFASRVGLRQWVRGDGPVWDRASGDGLRDGSRQGHRELVGAREEK